MVLTNSNIWTILQERFNLLLLPITSYGHFLLSGSHYSFVFQSLKLKQTPGDKKKYLRSCVHLFFVPDFIFSEQWPQSQWWTNSITIWCLLHACVCFQIDRGVPLVSHHALLCTKKNIYKKHSIVIIIIMREIYRSRWRLRATYSKVLKLKWNKNKNESNKVMI